MKDAWDDNPPTHTLLGVSGLAMGSIRN
ncbi:hypothetical protein C7E15_02500 [Stenotrophomonas maltophilia]|nr:hypothetical protein C7E15_02500 [Stenotrophomonas maltophilia]